MLSFKPPKYQLDYCYPNTYATFVQAVRSGGSVTRVCYLGVEGLRMFLDVREGKPVYTMYERNECSWQVYTKRLRERPLDLEAMLGSAAEFEKELAETFFYAFPRAEETFYDTFPRHKEVIAFLSGRPTTARVEELRLVYSVDKSCAVDDADGIVTITCDDGRLCVPYDDTGDTLTLQMYRAKFHPDSFFASLADSLFDWCYCKRSALSTITWGGVLSGIDRIVK